MPLSFKIKNTQIIYLIALIAVFFSTLSVANNKLSKEIEKHRGIIKNISNASLLIENSQKNKGLSIASQKLLVPASTLKIVTAYLAIKRWGLEHRFHTDFYIEDEVLWIKGYGDPYITSEEIALMSMSLKDLKMTHIKKIKIDNTYFPELRLNGRGTSDNPYDAGNAAVVVNFNTVMLKKQKGNIISGEQQTPLTPLARALGDSVKGKFPNKGKRISLPNGRNQSALYFGQVFSAIHLGENIVIEIGSLPDNASLIYRHYSSKKLSDLLSAMLKYSNNFIANQLFLLMPEKAETVKTLNVKLAQQNYLDQLQQEFLFDGSSFIDGAGLSRLNKISAKQMLEVLNAFRPWLNLLPEKHKGIKAKTGTLSDNHSLAGYIVNKKGEWRAFVLMINKKMPYNYRFQVAQDILNN